MSSSLPEDTGPPDYSCDSCGRRVAAAHAFAPMETLEVRCVGCLRSGLKPCAKCGTLIRASAYQHLPSGAVLCEPCVLDRIVPQR
jgi:hypothetical protein